MGFIQSSVSPSRSPGLSDERWEAATQAHGPPLQLSGDAARYDHRKGNDDYGQAGPLFRLLPADEKERLFDNLGRAMSTVPKEIQERQVAHFAKADPAYGAGVAKRLGLPAPR